MAVSHISEVQTSRDRCTSSTCRDSRGNGGDSCTCTTRVTRVATTLVARSATRSARSATSTRSTRSVVSSTHEFAAASPSTSVGSSLSSSSWKITATSCNPTWPRPFGSFASTSHRHLSGCESTLYWELASYQPYLGSKDGDQKGAGAAAGFSKTPERTQANSATTTFGNSNNQLPRVWTC